MLTDRIQYEAFHHTDLATNDVAERINKVSKLQGQHNILDMGLRHACLILWLAHRTSGQVISTDLNSTCVRYCTKLSQHCPSSKQPTTSVVAVLEELTAVTLFAWDKSKCDINKPTIENNRFKSGGWRNGMYWKQSLRANESQLTMSRAGSALVFGTQLGNDH